MEATPPAHCLRAVTAALLAGPYNQVLAGDLFFMPDALVVTLYGSCLVAGGASAIGYLFAGVAGGAALSLMDRQSLEALRQVASRKRRDLFGASLEVRRKARPKVLGSAFLPSGTCYKDCEAKARGLPQMY